MNLQTTIFLVETRGGWDSFCIFKQNHGIKDEADILYVVSV